jgi:hypothetical protein
LRNRRRNVWRCRNGRYRGNRSYVTRHTTAHTAGHSANYSAGYPIYNSSHGRCGCGWRKGRDLRSRRWRLCCLSRLFRHARLFHIGRRGGRVLVLPGGCFCPRS